MLKFVVSNLHEMHDNKRYKSYVLIAILDLKLDTVKFYSDNMM